MTGTQTQTRYLNDFMNSISVKCSWTHDNSVQEDTFYSFSGNGSSCIDYFMLSNDLYEHIYTSVVVWHGINLSPHQPVSVCIEMDYQCEHPVKDEVHWKHRCAWYKAKECHINQYKNILDEYLRNIDLSQELIVCNEKGCNDQNHLYMIDVIAEKVIESCIRAADMAIPHVKGKQGIPKWNEQAKPALDTAMFWHNMWIECDKPNQGVVHELRKKTRKDYHMVVKGLKKDENLNRSEKMAEAILNSDTRRFWDEARKMNPKSNKLPHTMDGVKGAKNIAELFSHKYKTLFNSVPYDDNLMKDVETEVNTKLCCDDLNDDIHVTVDDYRKALQLLNTGKNDGFSGLESDHLKHGSDMLNNLLTMLLNLCFTHCHMPTCLNVATIVPIPKDARGSMMKGDNYRGIGLCSSIMKIMDIVMIMKSGGTLGTSELQFAYKAGHSTTMSTMVLKETIRHYRQNGSPVYACF